MRLRGGVRENAQWTRYGSQPVKAPAYAVQFGGLGLNGGVGFGPGVALCAAGRVRLRHVSLTACALKRGLLRSWAIFLCR